MDHADPPMPTNEELLEAIRTLMQVSMHVQGSWVKLAMAEALGEVDGASVITKPSAVVICYAPHSQADLTDFIRLCTDFEKAKGLRAFAWGAANTEPGARPGGMRAADEDDGGG